MTTSLSKQTKKYFNSKCEFCGYLFKKPFKSPTEKKYCDDVCTRGARGKFGEEHEIRKQTREANAWLMKIWRGENG